MAEIIALLDEINKKKEAHVKLRKLKVKNRWRKVRKCAKQAYVRRMVERRNYKKMRKYVNIINSNFLGKPQK